MKKTERRVRRVTLPGRDPSSYLYVHSIYTCIEDGGDHRLLFRADRASSADHPVETLPESVFVLQRLLHGRVVNMPRQQREGSAQLSSHMP